MKTLRILLTVVLLAAVSAARLAGQSPSDLFQKALAAERADGNLREAIRLYEQVATQFAGDRSLAARALLRKADCLLKLGDADARATYERIAREFGDQKAVAAEATSKLRALEARSGGEAAAPLARRVWAPEIDFLGAVSGDGRLVSFVDWTTGDLAVHEVGTGVDRRLNLKGSWLESAAFALWSTISADGRQIAYVWFGPSPDRPEDRNPQTWIFSLRTVGSDGRNVRTLYANSEIDLIQPHAWSADGSHIAVTFTQRDGSHRIAVVRVADGSVRIVTSVDWRTPEHVSFSPDGRFILYDFPPQEESPNRDVFLLAVDGSSEVAIVPHPANDVALGWVPQTSSVLFSSDRTGAIDAWTVPIADGKAGGEPRLVKRAIGRIEPLGFSVKGGFYYGLHTGMQDVYIAQARGAGDTFASAAPATQRSVGANRAPAWSPDGRLIAFTSGVKRSLGGGTPEFTSITIRTIATGEERDIVPQIPKLFGLPRWSPDGRSLIANGYDRRGREGLYTIDVASGRTTALLPGSAYDPAWSPDGTVVFYRRGQQAIVAYTPADQRERDVFVGSVRSGVALSLDGKYLAFRSLEKTSQLRVIPVAGGEPRTVGEWPADAELRFAWETDSRHLRVTSGGTQWRVDIAGTAPEAVGKDTRAIQEMAFSPDGAHVAFTAGESKAEVWALENFLPATSAKR